MIDKPFNQLRVVLSGRYDVLHPGQVRSIEQYSYIFKFVHVLVWDGTPPPHKKRSYPPEWAVELLRMSLRHRPNVSIELSQTHFGHATKESLAELPEGYDVFLSGNNLVSCCMRALGVQVIDVSRTFGYDSSTVKARLRDS